jgi:glucose/arabinose dehydrogenase
MIRFAPALLLGLVACTPPAANAGGNSADAVATPSGPPFVATKQGQFDTPFAMAFLPDGSLLVTEKAGKLKLRDASGHVRDVAGAPTVKDITQGGLLDVAIAPDFASSHTIYLTYSEPRPHGASLALARATLVGTQLQGLNVIWRQGSDGEGGQFGANIAFAPDGKSLFLSSGERQRFTPAQDINQKLGKILHLTLDGRPAPGNPFAGKTGTPTVTVFDPPANTGAAVKEKGTQQAVEGSNTAPAEIWSMGHRNPYGLAFDSGGRLWEIEMGPKGGDEVNLILPGKNYGWPKASNGSNYDGTDIPDHKAGDGFEAPKVFWNPSISPGGMMIYSGDLFPQWKGSAFIAALSGEALIRVKLDGDRATKADQWAMNTRIRDVAQGPDGAIWLLQDDGALMKLMPH